MGRIICFSVLSLLCKETGAMVLPIVIVFQLVFKVTRMTTLVRTLVKYGLLVSKRLPESCFDSKPDNQITGVLVTHRKIYREKENI